jgi:hypothetical protein
MAPQGANQTEGSAPIGSIGRRGDASGARSARNGNEGEGHLRSQAKASSPASTSSIGARRALLTGLFALVLLAMLIPGSAEAAKTRLFVEPFGSAAEPTFSSATSLAVDQSNGDLLVLDTSAATVRRFNPDGTPASFSALGTNVIDGQGPGDGTPDGGLFFGGAEEVQIAVDNSGGATDGNIYVTDAPHGAIDVFASDGHFLSQLTESSAGGLGESCGVAVDPEGNVFVSTFGEPEGVIHKFEPSGGFPIKGDNTLNFSAGSPCTLAAGSGPSAGSVFVAKFGSSITKFSSTTGALEYVVDAGSNITTSVDPVTGHVFAVPRGGDVLEYDASGAVSATEVGQIQTTSPALGAAAYGTGEKLYVSRSGAAQIDLYGGLIGVPGVTTNAGATGVTKSAATVSGTVNPEGALLEASGGCFFEYGETTAYGQTAPCAESAAAIGEGTAPVPVHANLTGLVANTTYHLRLVGKNAAGTVQGEDKTFQTALPDLPVAITGEATPGVTGSVMDLAGTANPGGSKLNCHFEYGPTTAYGEEAPCIFTGPPVSSLDIPVTVQVGPLSASTTYHYRVVVSNPSGTVGGADRSFTTGAGQADSCPNAGIRAEQGIEVELLPDCMALEQVSPSNKGNQPARTPAGISDDDRRVLYNSIGTLSSSPNLHALGGDAFVATRGASGWTTQGLSRPLNDVAGGISQRQLGGLSPEYSQWFSVAGAGALFRGQLDGSSVQLSPALPITGVAGILGTSSDLSHVYLSPQASRTTFFLPGDPVPSDGGVEGSGSSEDYNVYIAHLASGVPTLELLARDRDGKAWGGNCGARLGGSERVGGQNLNLPNGYRNQGAISADGGLVYFSTRPAQPPTGNCTAANKKRIMERTETASGPVIEELISSECTRVAPACSPADGDDLYQGASVDQSKVYFTTNRQLANSDLDGTGTSCSNTVAVPGCDLYLWDRDKPAGERLTQVSAGEDVPGKHEVGKEARVYNSIAAISADGSRVYFVAEGALTGDANSEGAVAVVGQPNLYTWDAETEKTDFIGTVAPGDAPGNSGDGLGLWGGEGTWKNGAYPVPIVGKNGAGEEVGGDGHILLFRSKAELTVDDTDGSFVDFYRYNADSGALERISKAAPGGSDNGGFNVETRFGFISGVGPGPDYAEDGRRISEDGETIVFVTEEGLAPGDNNGVEDAYMWRRGQLYRLPGSANANTELRQDTPVVSLDGTTVAYHTASQLLPSDGDSAQDVYAVRVGGGFPTVTTNPCTPDGGGGCQGPPGPAPANLGAASGSFSGAGNVTPAAKNRPKRCPKGTRKVSRKGKIRCVKRGGHESHHRAGDHRGAGK